MAVVTIRDVAREARVSVATVSRALNGIATVDPELVDRVRVTAERLGYVPNNVGRALRLQQSNSWAVIVQELNAFITSVVAAVENAAERDGTSVYLGITAYDDDRERRYLQAAISQRVSGLIVGRPTDPEIYSDLELPLVFVDRGFPESRHDSVSIDNLLAGRLIADHFWEQGFRRVAFISNDQPGTPVSQRSIGFTEGFAGHGAEIPQSYRRQTTLTLAGGKQAMLDLLRLPSPPEAVFCTNGPTTQGAHLALQAMPHARVALAGMDDEDWTALATPAVTVVQQPVAEIGETAARLLTQRIAGGSGRPRHVVLNPTLIVRESSLR